MREGGREEETWNGVEYCLQIAHARAHVVEGKVVVATASYWSGHLEMRLPTEAAGGLVVEREQRTAHSFLAYLLAFGFRLFCLLRLVG